MDGYQRGDLEQWMNALVRAGFDPVGTNHYVDRSKDEGGVNYYSNRPMQHITMHWQHESKSPKLPELVVSYYTTHGSCMTIYATVHHRVPKRNKYQVVQRFGFMVPCGKEQEISSYVDLRKFLDSLGLSD